MNKGHQIHKTRPAYYKQEQLLMFMYIFSEL